MFSPLYHILGHFLRFYAFFRWVSGFSRERAQQSPAANPVVGGRKLHKLFTTAGLLHQDLLQGWGSINITCKESDNNMTFYFYLKPFIFRSNRKLYWHHLSVRLIYFVHKTNKMMFPYIEFAVIKHGDILM